MFEKFFAPRVQGALRHFLGTLGPMIGLFSVLIREEIITTAEVLPLIAQNWEIICGFGMALLALIGSLTAKEKREAKDD